MRDIHHPLAETKPAACRPGSIPLSGFCLKKRRLSPPSASLYCADMKFWASVGVTVLGAVIIGAAMVHMAQGKGPALFLLSIAGFVALFGFFCLPPKGHGH
jgi:hypothetical protein